MAVRQRESSGAEKKMTIFTQAQGRQGMYEAKLEMGMIEWQVNGYVCALDLAGALAHSL